MILYRILIVAKHWNYTIDASRKPIVKKIEFLPIILHLWKGLKILIYWNNTLCCQNNVYIQISVIFYKQPNVNNKIIFIPQLYFIWSMCREHLNNVPAEIIILSRLTVQSNMNYWGENFSYNFINQIKFPPPPGLNY